jgi:enoyl reductase-like protein
VKAPGADDKLRGGTCSKESTGGILSVSLELGELIHKIATRAVKLWKAFNDKVSVYRGRSTAWLQDNKKSIIEKLLNKDFAKPWFPPRRTKPWPTTSLA